MITLSIPRQLSVCLGISKLTLHFIIIHTNSLVAVEDLDLFDSWIAIGFVAENKAYYSSSLNCNPCTLMSSRQIISKVDAIILDSLYSLL